MDVECHNANTNINTDLTAICVFTDIPYNTQLHRNGSFGITTSLLIKCICNSGILIIVNSYTK
jgi:hypothetical protein